MIQQQQSQGVLTIQCSTGTSFHETLLAESVFLLELGRHVPCPGGHSAHTWAGARARSPNTHTSL